jgi:secondary thiamine-phosphate synthase enzyme
MKIVTEEFTVPTRGFSDVVDITDSVSEVLRSAGLSEGNALVFVPGATAGITTIEYEPGLLKDYPEFMEKIIPSNKTYHHDDTWHDGNGFSHVRAALQGASFTVPFKDNRLFLGTWQQIILVDFDNRSRNRRIVVQLTGI